MKLLLVKSVYPVKHVQNPLPTVTGPNKSIGIKKIATDFGIMGARLSSRDCKGRSNAFVMF